MVELEGTRFSLGLGVVDGGWEQKALASGGSKLLWCYEAKIPRLEDFHLRSGTPLFVFIKGLFEEYRSLRG